MIVGRIERLEQYLPHSIKASVLAYINNIDSKSVNEVTYINEEKVYGKVMSYKLKASDECKLEAHNRYIDIQITLEGIEGIEVYCRDNMEIESVYNKENDVIFFKEDTGKKIAKIYNKPGSFSMFWPEDVHKPMVMVDDENKDIKKFVVKIDKMLFD